ncbi:thiamine pyrophosphate-binding protein [Sphingobium sp. Sx8-8]|uniref:thiamine pyrophosphate-binding protein n=1 Tax=Sphingobium sp. Sx8-8 TaxID=2933617 RepID=UPI001F56F224|nr:thiamine pyrophosphate-binding protein [Sphingobium sp. Sx8-8]
MAMIAGKHAFLELLRQEGVEYLFGNPGTTELTLMDAYAVEKKPQYVLALHEGSAMGMAHGYAVATGKLAAVNLHAAPGLGNALGMLYNAKKAGAPILVTAGQHHNDIALAEPLLWDDLAVMARPYVKWSTEVRSLEDLPRALHRACKVALTPPMGPVFLSLPDNVLSDSADIDMMAPTRVGSGLRADASVIAHAAELIAAAKAPLIFAGDAVSKSFAHPELVALAELIGAPVYCEAMADSASFPASHPLFAGLVTRLGTAVQALSQQHDLVISIGGDLFTMSLPTGAEAFAPGTRIVHLDVDPWELGKNFPTEAALLGDPKATLPELTAAIADRQADGDRKAASERRSTIGQASSQRRRAAVSKAQSLYGASPIQPMALLHLIGEILPSNAVVVEEILSSNPGLRDLIISDDPQSYYGLRGGGIGMALPQAIGAKLAMPDRPVVALSGDGSALYSIQSLWTAMNRRLAIPFLIFNNRSYRILKQRTNAIGDHAARTGHFEAMDLIDPMLDFTSLAKGWGMPAVRVETLHDVRAALPAALASELPTLIDIAIDTRL